ncbi:MAG: Type A flavoprotein FprA [Methanocella sp. PtaU1.Bin125]|nr:MAG: Type A flavoprotein FprA [Methanocella sp. PtaU1.Bin125]
MDETRHVEEIADSVYWVGARDWDRKTFDAFIPLPQGTTYNAYLVKGREHTALIDTVNPGFWKQLHEKVDKVDSLKNLRYLVMNHAEPDHASAVPYVMGESPDATLVTTAKGAKMAKLYSKVPDGRILVVKDGDAIDLGGKTLAFIEAPWLHWPETMFTYLPEDRVLFSCDYFGAHTAFGMYDDENEGLLSLAKRYYGEIMMPFGKPGQKALEKIEPLDIRVLAPSHGPVYRNPGKIVDEYRRWTAGETKEKAIVAFVSMWGTTDRMAKAMAEALANDGIEVCVFNLQGADVGDIARELVDARALVLGSPTVLGGLHPLAAYAASLVKVLRPPLKYAAFLGSYGWGGGAARQALELLGPLRIDVVGAVDINGPADGEAMGKVADLARALSAKIKGATGATARTAESIA